MHPSQRQFTGQRLPSNPAAGAGNPFPAGGPKSQPHPRDRFVWRTRVYYEDTDAAGLVYYANYLRFFERCRTEWLRALGFGQRELVERDGVMFVVAAAEIRYLRSARLDDELEVDAVAQRFASYVVFEQAACRGAELLAQARIKVACVDARTGRPMRLPAAIAAALTHPLSDSPAQTAQAPRTAPRTTISANE